MGWYLEANGRGPLAMCALLSHNCVPAADGRNSPRQRRDVMPVTVNIKQRLYQAIVAIAQGSLQLSKPTFDDCQVGFSPRKHV